MTHKPSKRRFKREISVTFMSGPLDGKKLSFDQPEIGEQVVLNIGRREGSDVYLPFDNQVSRLHARLGCASVPVTGSDVYLPFDNQVSRLHARLGCASVPVTDSDTSSTPSILTFWLEDGGSRNGTYVEKEPEPIGDRVNLRPGTLFRIGRTWLRLDIPMSYGV